MCDKKDASEIVNRWVLWTTPTGGLQAIAVKTYLDQTDESILRGVMNAFVKYEYLATGNGKLLGKYPIAGT